MRTIYASNPDDGLVKGLLLLRNEGVEVDSRNGPVLMADGPVTTAFARPWDRVSRLPLRDANPFFHLIEALWMLAGRNDAWLPAQYAQQINAYAESDGTLNGAYGHRWRRHFGHDQLAELVRELRRDPLSRRCVLTMWDGGSSEALRTPNGDLQKVVCGTPDVPCNTHVYFDATRGPLDMTVCCRSNDIVWGTYGANVAHFSMLHEFVATAIGAPQGTYYQMSNNYHTYKERPDVRRLIGALGTLAVCAERESRALTVFARATAAFVRAPAAFVPLLRDEGCWLDFLDQCEEFCEALVVAPENVRDCGPVYGLPFFRHVAVPMAVAHALHKEGDTEGAVKLLEHGVVDWHVAGRAWLQRRLDAKRAKEVQS